MVKRMSEFIANMIAFSIITIIIAAPIALAWVVMHFVVKFW